MVWYLGTGTTLPFLTHLLSSCHSRGPSLLACKSSLCHSEVADLCLTAVTVNITAKR